MNFSQYKSARLARPDYSRAGAIDVPIQKLCARINSHPSFATLSSCSGRICLLEIGRRYQKNKMQWLIKTHALAHTEQFLTTLKNYRGNKSIVFRSEPPILHVAADSLESAEKLLKAAAAAGFKKSSFLSLTPKIVVEIASTELLVVPIYKKEMIVNKQYLYHLIRHGNKNLKKGWKKIAKLKINF